MFDFMQWTWPVKTLNIQIFLEFFLFCLYLIHSFVASRFEILFSDLPRLHLKSLKIIQNTSAINTN